MTTFGFSFGAYEKHIIKDIFDNIVYITTEDAYRKLIDELSRAAYFGIDTEGTSLDHYQNKLLLVSFYVNNCAYVVDFTILSYDLLKELAPILENEQILKIGHNLVYEWKVFYHHARIVMEGLHDTMVIDRALYAGLFHKHDLKSVVYKYLDIEIDKEIRDTFITWQGERFTQEQIQYSAMDAVYPVFIHDLQMRKILDYKLERIYKLEMDIIPPTGMMEYTGISVNKQMLEAMVEPFERFIAEADRAFQRILIQHGAAERIIFTEKGFSCINSRAKPQVLKALNEIGLDIDSLQAKKVQRWDLNNSRRNKKKSKKELEDLEIDYHTFVDDSDVANALNLYTVLDHKVLRAYTFLVGARILLSTFIYGLIEKINPITGKIHPNFNTYGAEATGRYSSNGPNFQNIPKNDKLKNLGLKDYSIRECIEAGKGRKLVIADYAGIELTILAVNSGDKKLLHQITEGDIHTYVCREVLGNKEITKENKKKFPYDVWRDGSKKLSYGIAYGTTGRNISEVLNILYAQFGVKYTPKDGDELIDRWFKLFPDTKAYLMSNARKAVMDGYVTDSWGRRRNWDKELLVDKWKRLAAGREGMNAPIQGTSATMTKRAIKLIWDLLDRSKARIIITVHDEIVVESTVKYVETAARIVKKCMEQAIRETLPAIADIVGMYESTSVSPAISDRYDK